MAGGVTANFLVRGGADFSSLRREMAKTRTQVADFSKGLNNSFAQLGTAFAAVGAGFAVTDAVNQAVKVEGALSQITRLMGDSADEFVNWANTSAYAFNLSKGQAIDFGRTFANLTSTFTSSTEETMSTTMSLLKASSIVASNTGRDMEDVMWRIRSGMLGNTEAIEDLGINVYVNMLESTEAFKMFAGSKSWEQLDFKTQSLIRYFGILEQTATKFGTTISDTTGAKIQQFTAAVNNVKLAFGDAFLPILNRILPALTASVMRTAQAFEFLAAFSRALFGGKTQKDVMAQSKSVNGVADAFKAAGDQAKAADKAKKGFLAGFDEVNSITIEDGSGGAGTGAGPGGGAMPSTPFDTTLTGSVADSMDQVQQKADELAAKVRAVFQEISSVIVANKDIIVASLAALGGGFIAFKLIVEGTKLATDAFRTSVMLLQATMAAIAAPVVAVALVIAALTAAFIYFYQTNESFRETVQTVLIAIRDAMVDLWQNVLIPVGAFLAEVFVAAWDKVTAAAEWLYLNVLTPLGQFLLEFYNLVIVPLASVLKDVLAIAFQTVSDIAKSFWQKVIVPLGKAIGEVLGPAVEALSAVFNFLWNNVLVPFGTFIKTILLGIFGSLSKEVKTLWKSYLEPIATFVAGRLKDAFNDTFDAIAGVINGVKTTLIGVFKFITGVFTGDWSKAWQGLSDIVSGIFDGLVAIVKLPINLIIGFINSLIDGLNSLKIDIPAWMPGGPQTFGLNISQIPKLARGGIVDSPTMAMVGEAGREMIVPLENTGFVDKLAGALGSAVLAAMQMSNNTDNASKQRDVVIQIDGNTLARAINPYLTKETARLGNSLITIR